jgi:CheY-like chemotaxis protein
MPDGGKVTIETQNTTLDEDYAQAHAGMKAGIYVQLTISDTGHGMSQETQDRIWEPFFTTKEMGKGTGLGLSIVYGIVKQNGGEIWVDSTEGKGTTFRIYLPATGDERLMTTVTASAAPSRRGSETILLVEDEPNVRKLVKAMLIKQGHTVLESRDVHDAIELCKDAQQRIDLLLTDVVMPDLSGPELAEQLRELHPHMQVLYMSGYADNVSVRPGVLPADAAFVQKPFTPEMLNNKVREVLDSRRLHAS